MTNQNEIIKALSIILDYAAIFPWKDYCKPNFKKIPPNQYAMFTTAHKFICDIFYNSPKYKTFAEGVALTTSNKYVQFRWLTQATALQLAFIPYNRFMRNTLLIIAERILSCNKALPESHII